MRLEMRREAYQGGGRSEIVRRELSMFNLFAVTCSLSLFSIVIAVPRFLATINVAQRVETLPSLRACSARVDQKTKVTIFVGRAVSNYRPKPRL